MQALELKGLESHAFVVNDARHGLGGLDSGWTALEMPGETSETKSPKDPKKGETQRKRAELNGCEN